MQAGHTCAQSVIGAMLFPPSFHHKADTMPHATAAFMFARVVTIGADAPARRKIIRVPLITALLRRAALLDPRSARSGASGTEAAREAAAPFKRLAGTAAQVSHETPRRDRSSDRAPDRRRRRADRVIALAPALAVIVSGRVIGSRDKMGHVPPLVPGRK